MKSFKGEIGSGLILSLPAVARFVHKSQLVEEAGSNSARLDRSD